MTDLFIKRVIHIYTISMRSHHGCHFYYRTYGFQTLWLILCPPERHDPKRKGGWDCLCLCNQGQLKIKRVRKKICWWTRHEHYIVTLHYTNMINIFIQSTFLSLRISSSDRSGENIYIYCAVCVQFWLHYFLCTAFYIETCSIKRTVLISDH